MIPRWISDPSPSIILNYCFFVLFFQFGTFLGNCEQERMQHEWVLVKKKKQTEVFIQEGFRLRKLYTGCKLLIWPALNLVSVEQTSTWRFHALPEAIMTTCNAVLTFESVDEILWCDHSNETSLAVFLHRSICFLIFYEWNLRFFLNFYFWHS